MAINETYDPNLKSWVESANDPATDFPIQNLPLCRLSIDEPSTDDTRFGTGQWEHIGVVIGDQVLDLSVLHKALKLGRGLDPYWGLIADRWNVIAAGTPRQTIATLRQRLTRLLTTEPTLRDDN